jgi:hypothetical protein
MEKTPELLAAICERIAAGESVRSVCRDEQMPAASTVFKWLTEDAAFSEQYARAKATAAEVLASELIEIADDGTNDYVERVNAKTGRLEIGFDNEHVQRSRLRVDTRKWYLSKILPKVYGDRLDLNVKGEITLADRIIAARRRVRGS